MTNLTDKWKKGELPSGWYYIEVKALLPLSESSIIEPAKYITSFDYPAKEIKKVLAPVPSYEELDNITKCYLCAHEKADRFEKENKRLKEQLEIAVKRIEFLKKKTGAPYYGNNTYLKTIYQMCDKTLRQIQEIGK